MEELVFPNQPFEERVALRRLAVELGVSLSPQLIADLERVAGQLQLPGLFQ